MPPAQIIPDYSLSTVTGLLSALLAFLFYRRGLRTQYPVFFLYCIFDAAQSLLIFLPLTNETFHRVQLGTFMLQWVFYFLLILELVDRIFSDHPGLARLGRRLVQFVMIVAACGAVATLRYETPAQTTLTDNLRLLFQAERAITGCLLIFILLINLFLWFFPVRLSRNTIAYCWSFTCFFLVKAIAPFFINPIGPDFLRAANMTHLLGFLLCQTIWLLSITQSGVDRKPAFVRGWSIEEQQKVLATLDSFEQEISRTRSR